MSKLKNLLIFSLVFALFYPFTSLNALEYGGIGGKPANPNPNNPRSKSIFIFTLAPNQVGEDELLVINNTQETKTLLIYATDSQRSSDGSFACEQYVDTKDNVGSWIKLAKDEVTLEPTTNEKVKFTLTAPDNIDIGESNGCIMIQEKKNAPGEEASGVSLSFRTGIRVVVTVPGEQKRELEITNFEAKNEGGFIKSTIDVTNSGNVSIDSLIKIKTTSIFGVVYNSIENEYPILRGEVATYNFEIPLPMWGGPFTLSAEVEYDESERASVGVDSGEPKKVVNTQSVSVFVLPTGIGLIVEVILLIVLAALGYFLYKKYKLKRSIQKTWTMYKTMQGETLNSIAQKFNTDWSLLAKVNKIKPPYELTPGRTIKVPSAR